MPEQTTNSSAESRLQSAEQQLSAISSKMSSSARITMVVGVVLLAAVMGYFIFGYREISVLFDPENLVALAGQMAEDGIPEVRQSVQDELVRSAPTWAETLSTQAIDAAPSARETLEDYALEQTEATVGHYASIGEGEFRKILRDNRAEFEQTIEQMAEDKDYTDETVQIFVDAINKELEQDMQEQSTQVLGTVIALNEKVQKLAIGNDLTKEERLERQILMIARYLQLREADESFDERKVSEEEGNLSEDGQEASDEKESDADDATEAADAADSEDKPADDKPAEGDSDSDE